MKLCAELGPKPRKNFDKFFRISSNKDWTRPTVRAFQTMKTLRLNFKQLYSYLPRTKEGPLHQVHSQRIPGLHEDKHNTWTALWT